MPPPELAADAPVLDVVHPVEIRLRPVLRYELDLASLDGLDCGLRQRVDLHVPLIGQVGLDNRVRAIAARDLDRIVLDLLEQFERFKLGDDLIARDEAIKATIGLRHFVVELGIVRQDVVHREIMALAEIVVVEVVCGCDFHATRTEFGVDVVVGDNRYTAPDNRKLDFLPYKVLVAFVIGVHSDRAVAEHCLRTRGRDDQVPVARGERIAEMP